MYFLGISMFMLIGTYASEFVFDSPLTPFSTLVPLTVVLGITMMKEGLEVRRPHGQRRAHTHLSRFPHVTHAPAAAGCQTAPQRPRGEQSNH